MHMLSNVKSLLRYWLERPHTQPSIPISLTQHIIGQTVQGTDIPCYDLGHGPTHYAVVAGIHGNEVGTVNTAINLLNWFQTQTSLHEHITLHVVPCLNMDGYRLATQHPDAWHGGLIGRANAHGVDLNRNFPTTDFQSEAWHNFGKNYSQRRKEFAGSSPGSEPETQAIINLLQTNNIKLYLALHNRAGDVTTSVGTTVETLAVLWQQHTGYAWMQESEWKQLGQTGTAKQWCEENNIIYFEIEERYRWQSDWEHCQAAYTAIFNKHLS